MPTRSILQNVTAMSLLLGMGLMTPMTLLTNSASAQLLPEDRDPRENRREDRNPRKNQQRPPFPGERSQRQVTIPAGTTIPTTREDAEKILVLPDETTSVTLKVAANIKNRQGRVLVPYGSEIKGEIQPYRNGSRFVAQELVIEGRQAQPINATSDVVTRRKTVDRGADSGDILEGALIGAGAASVLSGIFGDDFLDTARILGGAGLGALGGLILGKDEAEVISIDPAQDLDVTLESSLALSR